MQKREGAVKPEPLAGCQKLLAVDFEIVLSAGDAIQIEFSQLYGRIGRILQLEACALRIHTLELLEDRGNLFE